MKKLHIALLALLGLGLSAEAQSDQTYKFQHQVEMDVKSYNGDKVENTLNYVMLLPDDNQNIIGTEVKMKKQGQQVNATVIFELDSRAYTVLVNQGGMKIAMKNQMEFGAEEEKQEITKMNLKATGRTKEILGYSCKEYEMKNEEGYALLWVTEELKLKSFFESLGQLSKDSQYANFKIPFDGYVMQLTAWEKGKKKGPKSVMTVTKVSKNKTKVVSTAGYQVIGG
jgi:hypothetical protein